MIQSIPSSLNDALGGGLTTVVRYGDLFGAPESSVRNVQLVLGVYYYVLDYGISSQFEYRIKSDVTIIRNR